ncbi:MAG: T9SS type A sorting domain-containing protein, partial [Aestuariibaculum sp.]
IETWRCNTKINWTMGTVTTVDAIALDGINVVRFDNGNELENNEIGRAVYNFQQCGSEWSVSEIDMTFDDATLWNFSADPPGFEYDFESVVLHELGHAHMLGHVLNDGDVMTYSIGVGETHRNMNTNNKTSAANLMGRSTSNVICNTSVMTEYSGSCSFSDEDEILSRALVLYPNPTSGSLYIEKTLSVNLKKAEVYDAMGRKILYFNLSSGETVLNLERLTSGMYFVKLHSNSALATKKVVLE